MATCTRTLWKVLSGCQRHVLSAGVTRLPHTPPPRLQLPIRTFAVAREQKKVRKDKKEEAQKEVKKEKRVIDDSSRHKPFGRTAWAPVDDVYILRFYPRRVHGAAEAIGLLKEYQQLDFTEPCQPVYVELRLNMALEKKKKVDAFSSTIHLPHPFKTDSNSVVVFTENPDQVKVALGSGAAAAGGTELIQQILDDELSADFFVAVPEILPKIVPLKSKLRKKFPKSKRGTVGVNIPKMLELFRSGHGYMVENECYVRTQVATLDMPEEHIYSNLQSVLLDVCSHRPADMGPFVERAIINSQTSEALWFRSEDLLSKPAAKEEEAK